MESTSPSPIGMMPRCSCSYEQVCHGEVVQFQTYTADDTVCPQPRARTRSVVGFLCQIPVDVHCTVFIVRALHPGVTFRVEMSHGCKFTCGTCQGFLEQVARLGAELTTDDVLIESVVTVDAHVVETCLLTLGDTHLLSESPTMFTSW